MGFTQPALAAGDLKMDSLVGWGKAKPHPNVIEFGVVVDSRMLGFASSPQPTLAGF